MNIVKKRRKRDFKEADKKLDDLVLKYQLIERSKKKYEKDIETNILKLEKERTKKDSEKRDLKIKEIENHIKYDKDRIDFLEKKLDETKKGIKKWKERRELCK